MPSLEEAAVHYAELGYRVFPLKPKGKDPATRHGFNDASNVPETVRAWWIQNPDYNIGIATGDGLVVIDIDYKPEEGKDGFETLRQWEQDHGELPPTWMVLTGTGGVHYWYKTPANFKNSVELLPGIDIRSRGGYVVAPPSIHPNGNPYEWEASGDPEEVEISPLLGSAAQLIASAKPSGKKKTPYKERKKLTKGTRVDALMSLQGSLINSGLTEEAIMAAVRIENEKRGDPPLTEEELEKEVFHFLKRNIEPTGDYTDTVAPVGFTEEDLSSGEDLTLMNLGDTEEEPIEWLVPGYIPKGQVTALVGTGGTGKTLVWCSILASISRGESPFLTGEQRYKNEKLDNRKVMFFSGEDSVASVIKKRMTAVTADQKNIFYMDLSDERFGNIRLNSEYLARIIDKYKPAVCVFDPIQSFISEKIKMADRNQMRQTTRPLLALAKKNGTAFILVVHTNKMSNVWGRQRMADSADIWDICRSVLMVGKTTTRNVGYVSHEKSNYGKLCDTVLFEVSDDAVTYYGTTDKKDRDFVLEASKQTTDTASETTEACNFILSTINASEDGIMLVKDLDEAMSLNGFTDYRIRVAKRELIKAKLVYNERKEAGGPVYIGIHRKNNKIEKK